MDPQYPRSLLRDARIQWGYQSKRATVRDFLIDRVLCGLTRHLMWAPDPVAFWWYTHVCSYWGRE